jgi:hypothetical protein
VAGLGLGEHVPDRTLAWIWKCADADADAGSFGLAVQRAVLYKRVWSVWIFTLCWTNGFEERNNSLSALNRNAEMHHPSGQT